MKKCKNCNKEFEPIYPNQVYCSFECKRIYKRKQDSTLYYQRKEGKIIEAICIYCGKEFIKKGAEKYCSNECRRLYRNKQRRNKSNSSSKISLDKKTYNIPKIEEININGIIIKIEKEDNKYMWKAYRDNKLILTSAECFDTQNLCIKDARSAF